MSDCPIHGNFAPARFCCACTRERATIELVALADAMASAIEVRWSGPGGCDCEVCSAAKAWRRRALRPEGAQAAAPAAEACNCHLCRPRACACGSSRCWRVGGEGACSTVGEVA